MVLAVAVPAWSFVIEPRLLVMTSISVEHWPGAPMKVAFITDLHAGSPHIDERYIKRLVARINEQSPDLVLIGGDIAINSVPGGKAIAIDSVANWLSGFRAPLGTYAVLGNHDWWNDGARIRESLEAHGIVVLENQAKLLKFGDTRFWLVGVGDDMTEHADARRALSTIDTDDPRLLFMHDPAALMEQSSPFVLALAGHMHGGQLRVPFLGALVTPGRAPRHWANGWVERPGGPLYVSKGIGTSILPFRLNAPPEFVIALLRK